MYQHIIGTGGLPYIRLKGRAIDFVPHPEGVNPFHNALLFTPRARAPKRMLPPLQRRGLRDTRPASKSAPAAP